jgi:hypothetical protein
MLFSPNLKTQIQNFIKICPMEADLFRAEEQTQTDRRTDMMKPIFGFRNFANAPNYILINKYSQIPDISVAWPMYFRS